MFNLVSESQEIDANVSIDIEAIEQEYRPFITSLAQDLERYIDNTIFVIDDWEGDRIPVDISIALAGGNNNKYTARAIITSQRPVEGNSESKTAVTRFFEQQWSFEYSRGTYYSYNYMRYDPFATIIDYYMLMIIGADLDSYMELGGDPAYERARQVCLLGNSANADGFELISQPGEYTKYNLVEEMLNPRFNDWRKLVYDFFYNGLDLLADDYETGIANLEAVIANMADFKANKVTGPSVAIQAFFETKAFEIAQQFKGYESEQLFKNLMYLDPGNATRYQEAQEDN